MSASPSAGLPIAVTVVQSKGRGPVICAAMQVLWEQLLPTDPIGTFSLTLTNVVVGSRVRIDKQSDGSSFYDQVAVASTVVITLSAYAPGSANNDLRIKVRKGSVAPYYKPYETLTTALSGSASIYVSQILDE